MFFHVINNDTLTTSPIVIVTVDVSQYYNYFQYNIILHPNDLLNDVVTENSYNIVTINVIIFQVIFGMWPVNLTLMYLYNNIAC